MTGSEVQACLRLLNAKLVQPVGPGSTGQYLLGLQQLSDVLEDDIIRVAGDGQPQPGFSPDAWDNLEPRISKPLEDRLLAIKVATDELEGPVDPRSLMNSQYASNAMIACLFAMALVGTLTNLGLIIWRWPAATGRAGAVSLAELGGDARIRTETNAGTGSTASADSSRGARDRRDGGADRPAEVTQGGLPDGGVTAAATRATSPQAEPAPQAGLAPGALPASQGSISCSTNTSGAIVCTTVIGETTRRMPPEEHEVLLMIMLLGALGGYIHFCSSLAVFLGNRRVVKSWWAYYYFMPLEGAALAPVVYLLLRVGVLGTSNTANLNLWGVYAIAGLTGLFSKQAIEMLADVFATIFKKVPGKDSLQKKA